MHSFLLPSGTFHKHDSVLPTRALVLCQCSSKDPLVICPEAGGVSNFIHSLLDGHHGVSGPELGAGLWVNSDHGSCSEDASNLEMLNSNPGQSEEVRGVSELASRSWCLELTPDRASQQAAMIMSL